MINAYPPNYEQIVTAFNIKGRAGVVFTYGTMIYNPSGIEIAPDLMEHEKTHMLQQRNPAEWWDRYCSDPEFRLQQELEAYTAQYAYSVEFYGRTERRQLLAHISKTLAGPLYGYMLSADEAKKLIKKGVEE